MHKFFAKTRFLGKKVIFLPECHSTNIVANDLLSEKSAEYNTVIFTANQTNGKGQRGNSWESLPHQNATFSVIIKPDQLKIKDQFVLHMITALAVSAALRDIINVTVKWPNDIYINDYKVGGILIENSLRSTHVSSSIIGIGLNVNQTQFEYEYASSLKLQTGNTFLVEEIIEKILIQMELNLDELRTRNIDALRSIYIKSMYQIGEKRRYKTLQGTFHGTIIGITKTGKLQIDFDTKIETFDFKEVKFLRPAD